MCVFKIKQASINILGTACELERTVNDNFNFLFQLKKCVVESQSSIWEQCVVGNRSPSGAAGETKHSRSRLFFIRNSSMRHGWSQ